MERERHRIVIADDHQIVLDGVKSILTQSGRFEVLASAINYRELISRLTQHQPSVVLTDLNMPGVNGVEMVEALKRQFPLMKIVVLTMYHERTMMSRLRDARINGYLLKHGDQATLIRSLLNIIEGNEREFPEPEKVVNNRSFGYQNEGKFGDSFQRTLSLGKRQQEVLKFIGMGMSNQEIACNMFVSIETVYSHRKHIKSKLNFKNNSELTAFAVEYGMSNL